MGPIKLVELGGSHGKQRAPLQHLDLHPHLKHVRSRGHGDIGLLGLSEHPPDHVGCACLHARLVDRTRYKVCGAHGDSAAAAAQGVEMPPAAPTRKGRS